MDNANTNVNITSMMPENLDYEDDVDHELLCPICREPMLDPTIMRPCQHIFCSACIQNAFSHQRQQKIAHHCPSCRTEFILTDPGDDPAALYTESLNGHCENDLPNRLDILRVKCPNKGCAVIRERFLLPDHVQNHCPHTVFPCYDKSCSQSVERQHMRLHCTHELIECRHCHEWLERYQLTDHEERCPSLDSVCPSCDQSFPRNEYKDHLEQCITPEFRCAGLIFGCDAQFTDTTHLEQHQSTCTISRLGETIERQEHLLQAHRDALLTLTRRNDELEGRLAKVEDELEQEKNARSDDSRLDEMGQLLETQQQQTSERVAKAELLSFNSVQRQGQFNQYIEACLARMQTDLGAMHHALIRGRMLPGPGMPMPLAKPPGEEYLRPGSEGAESVSRPLDVGDDSMPRATRTMSAAEPSPQAVAHHAETGGFASLASLIPNTVHGPPMPFTNPTGTGTRPFQPQRPRRSSEERSVKL